MRFLTLFFLLVTSSLFAQDTVISVNEVRDYIGQEVSVQGKVDEVVSLSSTRGKPTYFNMGGKYPDNKFTLLLWKSNKHKFTKGVDYYEGRKIKVIGLIEMYRGKVQMVISDPGQIEVLE